ncbi:dipeptide epimerase [Halopenitus sp. H-Gu1]|uniref:dipeptide epimerase n=1 Tax=Halopenitus sp. H-Gu1 TaxID=3242697 RepID=UPI00359EFC8E
MSLETAVERITLDLDRPFTIARGTETTAENVIVRVVDEGGMAGIGAASPAERYGETAATVEAVLPELLSIVEDVGDPHALSAIERRMRDAVRDNPAARAAVSIALHDLVAKRLGVPLHRLWGLDPAATPRTSYTVGLDDPDEMADRARNAVESGYPILKVKLGTDRDRERLEAVRSAAPEATIRVDANEAWTPKEAVRKSQWLADLGVEFLEQPVPAENPEGLRFVYERSALPIAADESCVTVADVPRIADRCDIANLKLMKAGGLREARRMIATAHAHGLEVMIGCMIESNASIAAAAQLAPRCTYADLDGSLLVSGDPFEGIDLTEGRVHLETQDRPGTGVRE